MLFKIPFEVHAAFLWPPTSLPSLISDFNKVFSSAELLLVGFFSSFWSHSLNPRDGCDGWSDNQSAPALLYNTQTARLRLQSFSSSFHATVFNFPAETVLLTSYSCLHHSVWPLVVCLLGPTRDDSGDRYMAMVTKLQVKPSWFRRISPVGRKMPK